MGLQTDILLRIIAKNTSALDLEALETLATLMKTYTWLDGTGADQANKLFTDRRVTAGNDDLDLAGGLTNAFGVALTFAKLRALWFFVDPASTGNLLVGGGSAPIVSLWGAGGDIAVVRPGGFLALGTPDATGYVVTATTADILRCAASAGSVTYDIGIIGA